MNTKTDRQKTDRQTDKQKENKDRQTNMSTSRLISGDFCNTSLCCECTHINANIHDSSKVHVGGILGKHSMGSVTYAHIHTHTYIHTYIHAYIKMHTYIAATR